ncbi:MAG: hypothetical protein R2834_01925 [Rhodothermales bacterium]
MRTAFLVLAGLLPWALPGFAQDALLPPLPPRTFTVDGMKDGILLSWTTQPGAADPVAWEVYRTSNAIDNLPYTLLQTLPGSARSTTDSAFVINTGYYYYLVGVGEPVADDPDAILGTPGGKPLRSPRYATQTDILTAVGFRPGLDRDSIAVEGPNPFHTEIRIRYIANGPALVRLSVFNAIGQEVIVLLDDIVDTFASAEIPWAGVDRTGRKVPSGIYYCQLAVGGRYRKAVAVAVVR